jgi:hypothetical protein
MLSAVIRTKPFISAHIPWLSAVLGTNLSFDVLIYIINPVSLLCPVPRTEPFVFAYIPWLSAVFKTNPK